MHIHFLTRLHPGGAGGTSQGLTREWPHVSYVAQATLRLAQGLGGAEDEPNHAARSAEFPISALCIPFLPLLLHMSDEMLLSHFPASIIYYATKTV